MLLLAVTSLGTGVAFSRGRGGQSGEAHGYVGIDRNDYPGDAAMAQLKKEFSFTSYWLTPSPFSKANSWKGKRKVLAGQGWGFLLLARGRAVYSVKTAAGARTRGLADAQEAARVAKAEGFASGAILFLDVEEGGRLPATYHAYLQAWMDEVTAQGYRPGVYCSGLAVDEGGGVSVLTADDIRSNEAPRKIAFWVFNDACPPSPGCISLTLPPLPSASGVKDAVVWQFVRSPREKDSAGNCAGYAKDGQCYAGGDVAKKWNLDLNVAASANPSFD